MEILLFRLWVWLFITPMHSFSRPLLFFVPVWNLPCLGLWGWTSCFSLWFFIRFQLPLGLMLGFCLVWSTWKRHLGPRMRKRRWHRSFLSFVLKRLAQGRFWRGFQLMLLPMEMKRGVIMRRFFLSLSVWFLKARMRRPGVRWKG